MSIKKEKWILLMMTKFEKDPKARHNWRKKDNSVEVAYSNSRYSVKVGRSFCSPGDTFHLQTGIAIAYARLIDEEIPAYVLKDKFNINDIATGELFDLVRNQERYCKVKKVTSGYSCTNIKTGKHLIVHENEEVIPFYP